MKIRRATLSLLFVSTALYGSEEAITFASIDESVIHKYAQKITSEFKTNNVQKKVIYGTALLGLGYITYQCLYGAPTPPAVQGNVPTPMIPVAVEAPDQNKIEFSPAAIAYWNQKTLEEAAKANRSFIPAMYHWTKDNFSLLAQQVFVLALFTGLNNSLGPIAKYISVLDGALDKVLTRVFHEWNISWFLKQHTQLPLLFSTLEYHAKELAHDSDKRAFHAQQLQRTWNIMMHQLEYTFAFMHYSTTHKPWYSLAILQVQALQDTMKSELNNVGQKLGLRVNEFLVHAIDGDVQPILEVIQEFNKTLFQDFDAFRDLEKLEPY